MNRASTRSRTLFVPLAIACLALGLAACSSDADATTSTPTTTGAPSTTAVPATPTTTGADGTTATTRDTTVATPAGGPVPVGYQPVSVTAVSDALVWTLGTAPCGTPPCTSIVRTTDGGASYEGIPAPRAPLATATNELTLASVDNLRFADPLNGWAFGGGLYATHDGGRVWSPVQMNGYVLDVEAAAGTAWAVVARSCSPQGACRDFRIERTSVGGKDWDSVAIPTGDQQPVLALHGVHAWVLVNDSGSLAGLYATTAGDHGFVRYSTPCNAHLGGEIAPASDWVIYAQCATGTLSETLRSLNGGASFSPVHNPEVPNMTMLASSAPSVAYLAPDGAPIMRTTDAGKSFHQVLALNGAMWTFIGFTDPDHGYVIDSLTGSGLRSTMWRTTDGGTHWMAVQFRAPG